MFKVLELGWKVVCLKNTKKIKFHPEMRAKYLPYPRGYLPPQYTPPAIGQDPVLKKLWNETHENDNDALIAIAGKRGSTKSGCAISLGWRLDKSPAKLWSRFYLPQTLWPKDFKLLPGEILPRLIYKPTDFLKLINMGLPAGSVIVWDETGVEGDARDFATKKNKLLKRTFETVRSLNLILMMTAPSLKSFDVAFSRSTGFYFNTLGKTSFTHPNGVRKDYGIVKVHETSLNAATGKVYYPYLVYKDQFGKLRKLDQNYYIEKPPIWLEAPYKRYKKLFQEKLYNEYINELDEIDSISIDGQMETTTQILKTLLEQIRLRPEKYYDFKKKKFVVAALKFHGGLNKDADAKRFAELLEFKIQTGELKMLTPDKYREKHEIEGLEAIDFKWGKVKMD